MNKRELTNGLAVGFMGLIAAGVCSRPASANDDILIREMIQNSKKFSVQTYLEESRDEEYGDYDLISVSFDGKTYTTSHRVCRAETDVMNGKTYTRFEYPVIEDKKFATLAGAFHYAKQLKEQYYGA